MTGSRGSAVVLAVVVGSLGLAGCGASEGGAGAAPTSTSSPAAAPTTAPTSTAATSTAAPGVPSPGPPVRVTGRVEEGTRPQCRQLVTPGTTYLLLSVPGRLLVGQRVTVVGTVLDNVRTMCPGVPLGVLRVEGLAPPPPGQPTGRPSDPYPNS